VAAVADFLAVVHAERGVATPPRDQPLRQTR